MKVCSFFLRSCPAVYVYDAVCMLTVFCVLQQCVLDIILIEVLKTLKIIFLILRLQTLNEM